jgi:Flp pilus assembly pilin Flp
MIRTLWTFLANESAAASVEYTLIAVGVLIGIVTAVFVTVVK